MEKISRRSVVVRKKIPLPSDFSRLRSHLPVVLSLPEWTDLWTSKWRSENEKRGIRLTKREKSLFDGPHLTNQSINQSSDALFLNAKLPPIWVSWFLFPDCPYTSACDLDSVVPPHGSSTFCKQKKPKTQSENNQRKRPLRPLEYDQNCVAQINPIHNPTWNRSKCDKIEWITHLK